MQEEQQLHQVTTIEDRERGAAEKAKQPQSQLPRGLRRPRWWRCGLTRPSAQRWNRCIGSACGRGVVLRRRLHVGEFFNLYAHVIGQDEGHPLSGTRAERRWRAIGETLHAVKVLSKGRAVPQ